MVFWVRLSTKQIWHIQTAWSRIIAESIHLHEPSWTNLCHFVAPNQSTNLCNPWTSSGFWQDIPAPIHTSPRRVALEDGANFSGGTPRCLAWWKEWVASCAFLCHITIYCSLSWLFRYFSQAKSAMFWMQMSFREPNHPFGSTCHFRNRFFPPW